MNDTTLVMLVLHSLQAEAWSDAVLSEKGTIMEFKMRVNAVKNSTRLLNQYCASIMKTDEYDTSAEISDAFFELAKLPEDKIKEITELVKSKIKEYEN